MEAVTLGDLISSVYDEFLRLYNDSELASIATASFINDLYAKAVTQEEQDLAA